MDKDLFIKKYNKRKKEINKYEYWTTGIKEKTTKREEYLYNLGILVGKNIVFEMINEIIKESDNYE